MFLGKPDNHGHVDEYHITGAVSASCLVSGMVRINKHAQLYLLTKRLWSIWWQSFLDMSIEGMPISINTELSMVNPSI